MAATSSHSLKAHILVLVIIQLTWAYSDYDDYDSSGRFPMNKGVHVIDKGERKDGDTKLYSETLRKKGDSFGEDEYCYPQRGSTDQIEITEFEVKDQDEASNGGFAFEVSGGEGQGQVCFVLKARRGKSYNYKVDIYGYRLINGVRANGNVAGGSFGTTGVLGSGFGNTGAVGGALGTTGAGFGAFGSGLVNPGAGYGAVGSGVVNTGGYGAVGTGVGNTGGFGGVGTGRFGTSAGLNTNNNLMGGSYGNPAGYVPGNPGAGFGPGNPTGGYGSGFQPNGIGNTVYPQNQRYGSGNIL